MNILYRSFVVACTLSASLSLVTAASAKDIDVQGGRASLIDGVSLSNNLCHWPAKPVMSLATPPQHGRIDFRWVNIKMNAGPSFCKGTPTKAMVWYYSPQPGFHGVDSFTVGYNFETYEGSTETSYESRSYRVTVH